MTHSRGLAACLALALGLAAACGKYGPPVRTRAEAAAPAAEAEAPEGERDPDAEEGRP
jgi:hypothetical protein